LSQLLSKVGLTVTACRFYTKRSTCPTCCWMAHS